MFWRHIRDITPGQVVPWGFAIAIAWIMLANVARSRHWDLVSCWFGEKIISIRSRVLLTLSFIPLVALSSLYTLGIRVKLSTGTWPAYGSGFHHPVHQLVTELLLILAVVGPTGVVFALSDKWHSHPDTSVSWNHWLAFLGAYVLFWVHFVIDPVALVDWILD